MLRFLAPANLPLDRHLSSTTFTSARPALTLGSMERMAAGMR